MTTTDTTYKIIPSKKEILERLFKENHINFDELFVLLEENPTKSITIPYQPPYIPDTPQFPQYPYPMYVGDLPITICKSTNNDKID